MKIIITEEQLEMLIEKWSNKYKRSIDCNNPKGFSQRAHCQGRKKRLKESEMDDGYDLEKIKNYLFENNIEKIYVNENIQVNTENYLANFLTYSHI